MLAGAPPFADESLLATANRERHPVPRLGETRPEVTPAVADAAARALAPDPADRYPTADAMAEALRGGAPAVAHTAPRAVAAASAATAAAAAGTETRIAPAAATEVMPRPPGATRRPRALAIFLGLCVIGLAAMAVALRDDPSDGDLVSATDTTGAASAADIALTTPSTTVALDTTAVAAVAPETVTPTVPATEPPAPTAATAPAVDELVPGFPVPPDLESFHAQLARDPSLIGRHGVEVERELAKVLDERSDRKRGDRARELIAHADDWSEEGTLDVAVAEHLIALLEPLAGNGEGEGEGEGDD
jgi:serine/threonine-protein kinase